MDREGCVGSLVVQPLAALIGPDNEDAVGDGGIAEAEVEAGFDGGFEAAGEYELLVLALTFCIHVGFCADGEAIGVVAFEGKV